MRPGSTASRAALGACLILLSAATQVVPTLVAPAKADCDTQASGVSRPADARGVTFLGRLEYLTVEPYETSFTFGVTRVYAGQVSDRVTLSSSQCHAIGGFELGVDYLVSTSDPDAAKPGNTVAWRAIGRSAELIDIGQPLATYGRGIRSVSTVGAAARLMAPGSVGTKPSPLTPDPLVPLQVSVSSFGGSCFGGRTCVQLIEITAEAYRSGHWGAQVIPSDTDGPRSLTNGMPSDLGPGAYHVSASAWSTPMTGPLSLSGTPVACSARLNVGDGDQDAIVDVTFLQDGCRIILTHQTTPEPSPVTSPISSGLL